MNHVVLNLSKDNAGHRPERKKKKRDADAENMLRSICLFAIGVIAFIFCVGIGIYGYRESKNTQKLLTQTTQSTTQQVEDVSRVMETMQTSTQSMEHAVSVMDTTIGTMQDSLSEIRAVVPEDVDISEKMEELNTLSETITGMKEELARVQTDISRVATSAKDQDGNLTSITQETLTLSEKLITARTEIVRMTERMGQLQSDLEERVESDKELSLAIDQANASFRKTSSSIRENLTSVSDELKGAEGEIESLVQRAGALEAQLAANTAQLQGELNVAKADLQSALDDTATSLQGNLNETASNLKGELQSTTQSLQSTIDTRTTELTTAINNQYNLYTGDLETLRTSLVSRMESLEGQVDSCFQSVSEGKGAIASALTDEGVETSADASFQVFSNRIRTLSAGRYETGYNDGYANGFKKAMDGVSIEYTYHTHSGSRASGGGCYSVVCHEPGYYTENLCGSRNFHPAGGYRQCSKCGSVETTTGWPGDHNGCTEKNSTIIGYVYWVCENDHCCTTTSKPTECTVTLSKTYHEGAKYYALGCGKTEQTVETALLKFAE